MLRHRLIKYDPLWHWDLRCSVPVDEVGGLTCANRLLLGV